MSDGSSSRSPSEDRSASDPPRPASTVMLVRDGDNGVEVFMERRHIKSDFVGGAYVFPGGRVDPDDAFPEDLCRGLSPGQANRRLGLERGGLAFYAAAIRECFEEAGVLLAYDGTGELLDFTDPEREDHYRHLRDTLNDGEKSLLDITLEEGIRLATDRIHYWSHWITPEGQPRRYDTRFFIASAPSGQTAAHDDWELTDSSWVTPGDALERARNREWMIIFPTLKNLQQLDRMGTARRALEWAGGDHPRPAMLPRVVDDRVVLPGDDGYEGALRDVSKVDPGVWFRQFSKEE